jgi:AcrR family transcriptional regulator
MKRISGSRWEEVTRAATGVFLRKGYKRTQMADITEALGLSAGAIYRYVESKEALFDLAVRVGAGMNIETSNLIAPIATPRPGATMAFLRSTLKREGRIARLEEGLADSKPAEVAVEFEGIVRELYRKTAQFRVGIQLLDRSALDWPELAALWSGRWRAKLVDQLARYLDLRISQRRVPPVPDSKPWARYIVETVAFFALHRHYDPFPTPMSDKIAEDTAVSALVRATCTENSRKRKE